MKKYIAWLSICLILLFGSALYALVTPPLLLTEEQSNDSSVEVTLSPWILLSEDQEVVVQPDWVITVVQPLPSVIKMYKEKLSGQSN